MPCASYKVDTQCCKSTFTTDLGKHITLTYKVALNKNRPLVLLAQDHLLRLAVILIPSSCIQSVTGDVMD